MAGGQFIWLGGGIGFSDAARISRRILPIALLHGPENVIMFTGLIAAGVLDLLLKEAGILAIDALNSDISSILAMKRLKLTFCRLLIRFTAAVNR